jgi:hypothetical protein
MIDLSVECQRLLSDVGIGSIAADREGRSALVFEGATVIGFILTYPHADALLSGWEKDIDGRVREYQFGLRRAEAKAWNTYAVLLASAAPSHGQQIAVSAVEENLVGTRKIARAGVSDVEGVRAALLPLLPIQNAPRLEAVDMKAEIQLRTTELPPRLVEVFLSETSDATVVQVLEALS